ncbi:hypothetical protein BDY17DRAFT_328184 [Neohortaea acidophila]|uniref:Uncharacterized protein n=1 Tax=Neohortaea acidophila TaxID=245834 RepID=A0A6A6PFW6_9PEZI|nr:uncharacterized protein BDY17DRAFT_328184 [Neohortaea acidophila]KAF2478656.1 hypothetical protein BDY17DRAFT_328184 [Neohortaea acidophila]
MAPPNNIITDLDSQLASLNQLKPPGASKGKIASITKLCVENLQAESNIVQSLYRALKKAPPTHKLGAVYVIDSVVRRWIEQAKSSGQDLNIEGRGESGTEAAAIKRITQLMPALFDDTAKDIPTEQKEKLEGMIRIWEKGNTFPAKMLSEFRAKLSGASVQTNGTDATHSSGSKHTGEKFSAPVPSRPVSTPTGFPPQHLYDQGLIVQKGLSGAANSAGPAHTQPQPPPQQSVPAPPSDVNSILAALANTASKPPPQQAVPQPAAPAQNGQPPIPANIMAMLQQNGAIPPPATQSFPTYQPTPQQPTPYQAAPGPPPFQMPPNFPAYPGLPQPPPSVPQQYSQAPPPYQAPPATQPNDPLAALRGILPQSIINDQQKLVQALQVLQDLQKDGIPMEQWAPVLQAFDQQYQAPAQQSYGGYGGQARGRDRSRSPDGGRRRASPVYGNYDDSRKQKDEPYGGRNEQRRYRQRSPVRDSPAPAAHSLPPGTNLAMNGMPMQPKYIAIDNNLPRDSIKVLSRTLFVGGANGSQQEIQSLFERFGRVQTCIANRDKRHAFVKMTTRAHAVNAKSSMERLQASNDRETMAIARQTKWGVGFGPRECCDYGRGESIIPIGKLTDADMKWLLTAEYGGTGGQKVEAGMVLEEPDIEIGAGVSSKAMSRRVMPDASGAGAGGGKRGRGDDGGQRRDNNRGAKRHDDGGAGYGYSGVSGGPPQLMEQYGYVRPEPVAVATPPAVPGFGFTLPGSGGGQPAYR